MRWFRGTLRLLTRFSMDFLTKAKLFHRESNSVLWEPLKCSKSLMIWGNRQNAYVHRHANTCTHTYPHTPKHKHTYIFTCTHTHTQENNTLQLSHLLFFYEQNDSLLIPKFRYFLDFWKLPTLPYPNMQSSSYCKYLNNGEKGLCVIFGMFQNIIYGDREGMGGITVYIKSFDRGWW